MSLRTSLSMALVLLATLGALSTAWASQTPPAQPDGLRAIDGQWLYVEDRTEGRSSEKQGPPMSPKFALRVEEGAVVFVHGTREIRMTLDGKPVDITSKEMTSRYTGEWKNGKFEFDSESVKPDGTTSGLIMWEMIPNAEGLLVRVVVGEMDSIALYRHPQDIALPAPAKAVIGDLAWLGHTWVGTRGTSSLEERWSPPLGGTMLATSRTVNKSGKTSAFEYLRIVERDGGLVYIAQPGGRPPTEFTLTELSPRRAVFENPRHDSPQRIVYELSAEGGLTASIGFMKGGVPQRFEFKREGQPAAPASSQN